MSSLVDEDSQDREGSRSMGYYAKGRIDRLMGINGLVRTAFQDNATPIEIATAECPSDGLGREIPSRSLMWYGGNDPRNGVSKPSESGPFPQVSFTEPRKFSLQDMIECMDGTKTFALSIKKQPPGPRDPAPWRWRCS